MNKGYIIKAVYPQGGHTVQWNDAPMRFESKQAAQERAEVLTSKLRGTNTTYIVVEEE